MLSLWRRQLNDAVRQIRLFGYVDPTPWHDATIAALYPHALEYALRGYGDAIDRAERPAAWEKANPFRDAVSAVARLARNIALTVALAINGTTAARANEVARAAARERADQTELRRRLSPVFNDRRRAATIAANEMTRALHGGQLEGARDSGHTVKQWLAQNGACEFCRAMNGETVPIDEPFLVTSYGPVMGPPSHSNCRCTLLTRRESSPALDR